MGFTATEDYKTLLTSEFDRANVGTITGDPTIEITSLYTGPTTFESNGVILIDDEILSRIDTAGNYRQEIYLLGLTLMYDGTTSAVLKKIVTEIDRVNNDNNDSAVRGYNFKILYNWTTGISQGVITLTVEASRKWEVHNT